MHEHRRGRRVGSLEQVVEVQSPRGGNSDRPACRSLRGGGRLILLVVVVVVVVAGAWVMWYCGRVGIVLFVVSISGVEEGECVEGDVGRPRGRGRHID
jgi:hypothetical protein